MIATQYQQIQQCFYKHYQLRIHRIVLVVIKSNQVNGFKDIITINKWMSLSILLISLIIRTIIFDYFNMFYDFARLDGWEDYSQSPHTNQLKLLSESMEQTPRLQLMRDNKLNCRIRQVTEIRSPRKKSLPTNRIQHSQIINFDSPIKRKPVQNLVRVAPSQFNFTLSENKFTIKESSPKQKLNRLAPLLQKAHKIQIKNKIITITSKSPLTQLQKLLDVLNEK